MPLSLFNYSFFLFLGIVLVLHSLEATSFDECKISRCGDNGPPIRFPFWLKTIQPESCGYKGFELFCNKRNQTVLELKGSVKLLVKEIDYNMTRIYAHSPNSCLPRQFLRLNISADDGWNQALFNCSPPEREIPNLVPCLTVGQHQVYAFIGTLASDYVYSLTSCTKIGSLNLDIYPFNFEDSVYDHRKDIWLSWMSWYCDKCTTEGKRCNIENNITTAALDQVECLDLPNITAASWQTSPDQKPLVTGLVIYLLLNVVIPIAFYFAYTSHRTQKEDQVKINSFLEDYKALRPARYTFADIKKITNKFKEKLGEGSYGTVFKGKLSSEVFVAVKVLNNFTGNGEEFINEVRTMGGIHHVNVVRLVGFCSDGIKQALVYEFLPNDSLEKFIFYKNQRREFLGWEKLKDIALGIAKGIEYLHQGCEQRILHFDIKPHNILLDHNFNPKIADFGLAKLCSKDQSIVSMTATRGTMGYIAPEVFSRNFGNVSYKSDVYSFGMVLLEMVGGRKNTDVTVQNTTQTYFPEWVYYRLCRGQDLGILIEEEEHAQIAKRLTIIGLWCIQWNPVDRPSIKTAVQMLERKGGDALVMPPNPFASTSQSNCSSSSSKPARVLNIELAVIPEAE